MRHPLPLLWSTLAALPLAACTGGDATNAPPDLWTIPAPDAATPDAGLPPLATRVLLLSIDGMHGSDLEHYIAAKPNSALAQLAQIGARYRNVSTPLPSDSFPGVLAVTTGGTPLSTGIYYDLSYDRTLSPPSSNCATIGSYVNFTETVDNDSTLPNGGGGLATARLPLDPAHGCQVVYPHQYLRVNTAFEVVKAAGGRTAWIDKHLSYEVVNGPSGKGVDDLYTPEIAAPANKTIDGVLAYDADRVKAVLNQIAGKDHTGASQVGVPALFGMNFQAVSVSQKIVGDGYLDANGTLSPTLQMTMDATDQSIGTIVAALKGANLWDTTTVMITAVHGQSPIDPAIRKVISTAVLTKAVSDVKKGLLGLLTADDIALFWLTDPTQAQAVAQNLLGQQAAAGIDKVLWGDTLKAQFPVVSDRTPDVVVLVNHGVIYAGSDKNAEHGGNSEDDRKVFALVVGKGIAQAVNDDPLETRQIAPTALVRLGLDPNQLQAVRNEGTMALPGIGK